jgi:hypothetical protein
MFSLGISGLSLAILTSTPFLAQMEAAQIPSLPANKSHVPTPKDAVAQSATGTQTQKR